MDTDGKDDVPINWSSDRRHEHILNRRLSHRTRSISISIPETSIELNASPTNRAGVGPLHSKRKNRDTKKLDRESVEREDTTNHNHQHVYLMRSGQLGMCNVPYCVACPNSCYDESPLTARASQGFDHSNVGDQNGGAKAWVREKLMLLKHFTCGVVNPHAKAVQQWFQIVYSAGVFTNFVIDPLFCFLLSVKKDFKCIEMNWPMTITLVVLRSITDLIYLMQMLLQFRLAFIPLKSKLEGSPELVDHPRRIVLHYLSRFFFVDLFNVLPVPQILVLLILPNYIASSGANYANNLLRIAVLVQLIPRWIRLVDLFSILDKDSVPVSAQRTSIFIKNLMGFIMAGHGVGSIWYLLGLQRVNQCLVDACHNSGIANCMKFIDCGQGDDSLPYKGFQQLINDWKQNENSSVCFTEDGFPYGIYVQAVNLIAEDSIITRYFYSFYWGFQQISTLAGNQTPSYSVWEVLFIICVTCVGLLLYSLLIGNMQTYIQGLLHSKMERIATQRDFEMWMSRRHLPVDLRRKIRRSENYNWCATKGVKEEMLMESLPEDLQRDVRRHLFKFVKKVRIFSLMDEPILDAICERLRQTAYIKGSKILYEGGLVKKMLIIVRGKMESIGKNGNIVHLLEGDVCGEEFLRWCPEGDTQNNRQQWSKLRSNRTVKCLTNVEAFVIWAADLEEVTNVFATFFRNHRLQFAIRNESPYWQGVAATTIQVAWRYKKKRLRRAEI